MAVVKKPTTKTGQEAQIRAGNTFAPVKKTLGGDPFYIDNPTLVGERKPPMVATPQNPAVPMGNTVATYDETNPTDYIYRMQAKKLAGKVMSEDEQYNYLRAVAKSNEQKAQANPYTDNQYGTDLLAQQTAAREAEATRDTTALEAFKKQKDLENTAKIKLLEQQWVKQQDAAQRVLSFSWFGRSTAAAGQMADIQANTNQAINMANAANAAEIAKYKAELEWADSDTLQALDAQIAEYNKAAQTRQLESIKKTAEANQKNTVSFEDALKNLGDTSNAAGIDIGDTKDLQYYGSIVRNPDGTVNEEKLKTLPENVQALIRLAAQTSSATEAPKIENIGTAKNPRYVQWNGKERVPVAGWYTAGGWWSGVGGWKAGTPNVLQSELITRLNRVKEAANNSLLRSTNLLDPEYQADLNYIKANMTFDKLSQMKAAGVKLWVLSDSDMKLLWEAAISLTPWMKSSSISREVDRLVQWLGWSTAPAPSTNKGTTPAISTTPSPKLSSIRDSL